MRLGDQLRWQGIRVIGAEQPQRRVRSDSEVQQRLVELTFLEARPAGGRPRPAPYPTKSGALQGMSIDKVAPGRNDARGIAAQGGHVDELDEVAVRPQRGPQGLDPGGPDGDQHRLTESATLLDER